MLQAGEWNDYSSFILIPGTKLPVAFFPLLIGAGMIIFKLQMKLITRGKKLRNKVFSPMTGNK